MCINIKVLKEVSWELVVTVDWLIFTRITPRLGSYYSKVLYFLIILVMSVLLVFRASLSVLNL